MRVLAAIALGYFLVVGKLGGQAPVPQLADGLMEPARAELDRALSVSLDEPREFDPALDTAKRRVAPGSRVISLTAGCRAAQKPYDLLIHFHGAPPVLESAFEKSGIDGVLVIYNWGIGSGAYEDGFAAPGSFNQILTNITNGVRELCPHAAAPKRIGLSAWSAGYGAVWRILDRSSDAAKIDAVLLADGLHCGFVGNERERNINPAAMAPFELFADLAMQDKRLFAITHSSIPTPYASTTETSSYLLDAEGVPRIQVSLPGPRPDMEMTSRADSGSFHVRGFAGQDKPAHANQLYSFGDLLLPYLKERWR
ncbi:MAG TPA: hypothetical protein VEQ58_16980 [Polyangiaceae bacterium]|nr:hypothetical protein [Polyangiaceae bacterium]